jgi:hypothetical protein
MTDRLANNDKNKMPPFSFSITVENLDSEASVAFHCFLAIL